MFTIRNIPVKMLILTFYIFLSVEYFNLAKPIPIHSIIFNIGCCNEKKKPVIIGLKDQERIQACCSIETDWTNSCFDHIETRCCTVIKRLALFRSSIDAFEYGGHSNTENWRIHLRQQIGNTFQSKNLSTNIALHHNIYKNQYIID